MLPSSKSPTTASLATSSSSSPPSPKNSKNPKLAENQPRKKTSAVVFFSQAPRVGSWFLDQRGCLSDAAFYQVRFDLGLLMRQQDHLRLEGLISSQGNLDAVPAWADQHCSSHSSKLMDVAYVGVVEEDGCPVRCDMENELLRGLHNHFLSEFFVARLAHDNFMLAG